MKYTNLLNSGMMKIIIQHLFLMMTIFGDLVHGSCSPQTAARCSEGSFDRLKSWTNNPTEYEFNKLCKKNEDMWNCLTSNNCFDKMTALKSLFEKQKQECSQGYSALLEKALSGEDIDNACDADKYIKCVETPLTIAQNWLRNPTYTDYDVKRMCRANTDIWNCIVKTKCEQPELKEIFDNSKQACDDYNSGKYRGSSTSWGTLKIISIGLGVFSLCCSLLACLLRNAAKDRSRRNAPYGTEIV